MQKYKFYIGIFTIFVLGIAIGSLSTSIYIKHRMVEVVQGDNSIIHKLVMKKISSQLKLTQFQHQEVEPIVAHTIQEIYGIRKKNQPILDKIIGEGKVSIQQKLNAEQKSCLESMYQKLRENLNLK